VNCGLNTREFHILMRLWERKPLKVSVFSLYTHKDSGEPCDADFAFNPTIYTKMLTEFSDPYLPHSV
jgi:hypothetical protein